jgi:hypothetical protein
MSSTLNDVKIKDSAGPVSTWTWQVDSSATLIYPGDPVKLSSAGSPFVIKLATGEPIIGTTTQVVGIAATQSTNTAAAAGTVSVYIPVPGTVYSCKATTFANVNTAAELNALVGDRVTFDLSTATFTVDEDETDAATSGLQIVGGDYLNGDVYFTIRPAATEGPVA